MAFYDPTMVEVRVLLVDEDVHKLHETCTLLRLNSYQVTMVENVSVASTMLSKGKQTFDVVMVDITLPNVKGYVLLHEAVAMGLPVILTSSNASQALVKCAIEDGAMMLMERPSTAADLKYVWQHVLREKVRKVKQITAAPNMHLFQGAIPRNQPFVQQFYSDDQSIINNNINIYNNVSDSRITSTKWTPHLHEKFVSAVTELGEGRCFPESIVHLMKVPGLTKVQVGSHLQKCRLNWKSGQLRQSECSKARKPWRRGTPAPRRQRSKPKEYGALPSFINPKPRVTMIEKNPTSPPSVGTPNIGSRQGMSSASNNIIDVEAPSGVMAVEAAPDPKHHEFDAFLSMLFNKDDTIIANNFHLDHDEGLM